MPKKTYLTAGEAAAALNISRNTLYAYVSRGLIQSLSDGQSRRHLYAWQDIERLRRRKIPDSSSLEPAAQALAWGMPVMPSSITLIQDDQLYYRGQNAAGLIAEASLESLARLLWQVPDGEALSVPMLPHDNQNGSGFAAACAALAAISAADPQAYISTPSIVWRHGARIMATLCQCFCHQPDSQQPFLHDRLAENWHCREAAVILRAALVACADHELNASTFAVRVAASAKATTYAAVIAGLVTLEGPRHGGATRQVQAWLDEIGDGDVAERITARLRRGEAIPGFGHPLYRQQDPRAQALLSLLETKAAQRPQTARVMEIAATAQALTGAFANLDFALTAIARIFALPPDAPLYLFAIGRACGWVAHILEQYDADMLIRPRAQYIGPQPA